MSKQLAAGILAALVTFAYFGFAPQAGRLLGHPHVTTRYRAVDFTIFYCGGRAVLARANPYTIEPLTSCERAHWPAEYLPGFTEPVASPGSTLALFALLALLPYDTAKFVWLLLLCACFGVAVVFGARLSRAPPIAVALLLFVPVALLNVGVGQLAPIFCAAIFASVWFVRNGNDRAAALCALGACVEPHIGLPVVVTLFVLAPRTRVTLAIGTGLFAALHVALLGPTIAAAYVTSVLPAQAHAEYHAADQFGTVWWLTQLGVRSSAVAAVSAALYLVALAVGIAVAARATARSHDRALIVALALVLALVFTPFLHDVELGVALVAPLAALAANPRDLRWIACAVVLAVPWFAATRSPALAATSVICAAGFVALATMRRDVRSAEPTLATALAVAVALSAGSQLPVSPGPTSPVVALRGEALAAASWEQWIRSHAYDVAHGPRTVLPKLLTMAGLIATAL